VQGFEAAVGGGADGSGAFAQDVSCGGGVEAEDGAEQDGFGLVRGRVAIRATAFRVATASRAVWAVSAAAGRAMVATQPRNPS